MAAMLNPDQMIYSFDGFQVDAHKRLLLRDGRAVPLSSKAFDLLLALLESGGREITKEELMERVWSNQVVEDANLTVTMSHLRKALGEKASEHRLIVTIPGRGYRFVGQSQIADALIVEQRTVSHIVIDEFADKDKSPGPVVEMRPPRNDDRYLSPATQIANLPPQPLDLAVTCFAASSPHMR